MRKDKLMVFGLALLILLGGLTSTAVNVIEGESSEENTSTGISLLGDGTPEDPYMIFDVNDLQNMSNDLNAHYALANDIDASVTHNWNSNAGFEPVGDSSNPFKSSLDGQGYKIINLFINRSTTDNVGLFGYLDSGSKISNVSLVSGNISGNNRVGTLAGFLNSFGTVENCSVYPYMEQEYHLELDGTDEDYIDFGEMTGFMAGTSWSIIERVKIPEGADDTSGWHMFRGKAWEDRYGDIAMRIQNDTSTDNVRVWLRTSTWNTLSMDNGQEGIFINEGEWYDIGVTYNSSNEEYKLYVNGIEVYNSTSILPLDDSSNNNNLYFGGQDVSYGKGQGDLYSETDITIKHQAWIQSCLSPVEVYEYDGFVDPNTPALFFSTDIKSNRVLDISGNGHNGNNGNSPIYHNESKTKGGVVTGNDNIGGLVGENNGGTILSSYSTGDVTGRWYIGGLVGRSSGSVNESHTSGNVYADSTSGGLIGVNAGTVNESYSECKVSGDDGNAGGLVGYNTGTVTLSYATGDVNSSGATAHSTGGFIGWNNDGFVNNSYSRGDAEGYQEVGGFVGQNSGIVNNSYSIGYAGGHSNLGGFCGANSGAISDCFYDNQTSGWTTSDGGTGKKTIEMKNESTFTDAGWDFNETWYIIEDGPTYPLLKWQPLSTGSGTPEDPYLIFNLRDLQRMKNDLNANYVLMNDIDASETTGWNGGDGFEPIGNNHNPFEGSLEGQGYTISGLYINRTLTSYVGIIGYLASGEINNISILNNNIIGSSRVGGLVGYNDLGTISNCSVNGTVDGEKSVGGLVGLNDNWVSNCYADVKLTLYRVDGNADNAGGLVGKNNGIVSRSYAHVNVSGDRYVGGLVGYLYEGTIYNSYSAGFVTGETDVGGLIGTNNSGTVENSFWDNETSGWQTSAGGTGKNTTEMKTQSTFTDVGWDFTDTWWMIENVTYPLFIRQGVAVGITSPYQGQLFAINDVTVEWCGDTKGSEDITYRVQLDGGDWYDKNTTTTHDFIGVGDGYHTVRVEAQDNYGNLASDSVTFMVDVSDDPIINITSPYEGEIFSSTNVTVYWTGNDEISGIDYYQIRINEEGWLNKTAEETSHQFSGIAEGNNTVYLRAYDHAGNSAEENVTFLIDITAPNVNITSPEEGNIYNTSDITVNWTGSDSWSNISHYELRIDESDWIEKGSETSHEFTGLGEGNHTIEVIAYDNAGNDATNNVTFTLDLSGPTVEILAPEDGKVFSNNTFMVEWIGSDEISGMDHYEIRIDGGTWIDKGSDMTHQFIDIEEGDHIVDVRAFDNVGNIGTDSISLTVDLTDPTVDITAPVSGEIFGTTEVTVYWTSSDEVSGISYYEVRIDDGVWDNVNMDTSYTFLDLEEGEHIVDVKATDNAGHNVTDNVTFMVDISDPTVTITSPSDGGVFSTPEVTIEWTGNDDLSGIDHYQVRINEGVWQNKGLETSHTFTSLGEGEHTVDVEAYDNASNTAVHTVNFTIEFEISYIEISPDFEAITAGNSQTYTATAYDEYGGEKGDVTSETNWSIETGSGGYWTDNVYHSEYTGDWNVTADYEGFIDTATLRVLAGDVHSILLSPQVATITAGDNIEYWATAYDEFGNKVSEGAPSCSIEDGAGGSWSNRRYYSEFAGTWTVTGTYEGLEDTATLIVEPGDSFSIEILPQDSIITSGETQDYNATAYDGYGNKVDNVTTDADWSIDTDAGGYWDGSTYHSENVGTWAVTATYEGISDTVYLTVEHKPADYIIIEPQDTNIEMGASQSYTATAYDEDDNEIGDVTHDTSWSIDPDAGGYWTDNEYTSENSGTWTVTGEYQNISDYASLTVSEVEEYSLTIIAGEGGTTIPSPGTYVYEEGRSVTVQASVYEGFIFSHWTGDYPGGQPEEETINIVMDGDKTLTAHFIESGFEPVNLVLDVTPTSGDVPLEVTIFVSGENTGDEVGSIDVVVDGTVEYTLELPAGGSAEHTFTHTFDDTGSYDILFFDLIETVTVGDVPEFIPENLVLYIDPTQGEAPLESSISVSGDNFGDLDGSIDLSVDDVVIYTLQMPAGGSASHELTYNFTEVGTYQVDFHNMTRTVDVYDPTGFAPVNLELDVDPISGEPPLNVNIYVSGENVGELDGSIDVIVDGTVEYTLEIPSERSAEHTFTYIFEEIGEYDIEFGHLTETVVVEEDAVVYTLTVDTDGDGSVEIDPNQEEYEEGTQVNLTAVPDDGWTFKEWTGDHTGTETEISVTFDGNRTITAVFEEDSESATDDFMSNYWWTIVIAIIAVVVLLAVVLMRGKGQVTDGEHTSDVSDQEDDQEEFVETAEEESIKEEDTEPTPKEEF